MFGAQNTGAIFNRERHARRAIKATIDLRCMHHAAPKMDKSILIGRPSIAPEFIQRQLTGQSRQVVDRIAQGMRWRSMLQGNDNCVSFEGMKLQIPADRHRCHYVKTKVTVRRRTDGSLAIFHGPRKLADYEPTGQIRTCHLKAVA